MAIPTVFISSTAEDLKDYREAARDGAISAGFHPKMMEYFVASGKKPPLKKCLDDVAGSDVLVVIVAHRYGWVPPDQAEGECRSITWLECLEAERGGKEILAFLIDKNHQWPAELEEAYRMTEAIRKGKADLELLQEIQRNTAQLEEFKSWLNSRGIRATFTTREDLRGKVESALREWKGDSSGGGDPGRYLAYLREQTGWIDIRGLNVGSGKANRFPIEDLYIPLTMAGSPEDGKHPAKGTPERELFLLDDALAHPRLVIVGDPGSGKTTFLRRLAHRLSQSVSPFPIYIRVGELTEHIQNCRTGPGRPTTAESPAWIPHFLQVCNQEMCWGLGENFFAKQLDEGSCLLMLDGLDEAPNRVQRESVARLFEKATQAYSKCRLVVTTRPLAYTGWSVLTGFYQAVVEPLEPETVTNFLRHWCRNLFPQNEAAAQEHMVGLSEALRERVEIRRMARNPVMLTALAVVHWNDRRLPEQRAELYESIVNWLARAREARPGRETAERCLTLLGHLALAMQQDPKGRKVQAAKGWAAEMILPRFTGRLKRDRKQAAQAFLEEEEVDSGIIVSRGSDVRFWHLTFQEYLAARSLAGKPDVEQYKLLLNDGQIYKPEWRETALLLAGVLHVKQGPEKLDALLRALFDRLGVKASLVEQARCAGLLGAMVRDLKPLKYQPHDERYTRVLEAARGIFDPAKAASLAFEVRLEAAEALGQAGDDRLREHNWVCLPAGEFWMGAQNTNPAGPHYDPEAEEDETVHRVSLSSFEIGKYPVTMEEFQRFIEADGYQDPNHWQAGGFGAQPQPRRTGRIRGCTQIGRLWA